MASVISMNMYCTSKIDDSFRMNLVSYIFTHIHPCNGYPEVLIGVTDVFVMGILEY